MIMTCYDAIQVSHGREIPKQPIFFFWSEVVYNATLDLYSLRVIRYVEPVYTVVIYMFTLGAGGAVQTRLLYL